MSRLVQFVDADGGRRVARVTDDGRSLQPLNEVATTYELAQITARQGNTLERMIAEFLGEERLDYEAVAGEDRLLVPLDHPDDPAHCLVTGTGLSHLGSAESRDAMHAKPEAEMTDSMRMFKWGLEGGKPPEGKVGVQPEWFFKGDGQCIVSPGRALEVPGFALDGGEESEIAGLYIIDDHGAPLRVGYALANEFSDHVMERQNYLYLAHCKLRTCSFGPELLVGELPRDVQGMARLWRKGTVIWKQGFASGEDNMCHSLANLEHHHFKYEMFRRPGDVHCHFFGTATLSFSAGVKVEPGDVIEIAAEPFGRALKNPVLMREDHGIVLVKAL